MARQASELTKAIRSLCDQSNFTITHAQARPKLVSMGFKVAREPKDKTEAYRQWEAKASRRPKNADKLPEWYKATVKAAGLPARMVDVIMAEDASHRSFNNERNYFDVTKYLYQKKVGNHASTKPVKMKKVGRPAKQAPAAAEVVTVRKPKVVAAEGVGSVEWLVAQGGAAAVEKRIAALQSEAQKLTALLGEAKAALKTLASSAA